MTERETMDESDNLPLARRCGAIPIGERAMTVAERSRRYRRRHSTTRLLRLPVEPADRLTAEADRLGVEVGVVLAQALAAMDGRCGNA